MTQAIITLLVNTTSQLKHEHGIDTFIIHVTRKMLEDLLALCGAVPKLPASPDISPFLGERGIKSLVLTENTNAPGLFTNPNYETRQVRNGRARARGLWVSAHNPRIAKPSGVRNRHLFITAQNIWWSAEAGVKGDQVTTEAITVETLRDILRQNFKSEDLPTGP